MMNTFSLVPCSAANVECNAAPVFSASVFIMRR